MASGVQSNGANHPQATEYTLQGERRFRLPATATKVWRVC